MAADRSAEVIEPLKLRVARRVGCVLGGVLTGLARPVQPLLRRGWEATALAAFLLLLAAISAGVGVGLDELVVHQHLPMAVALPCTGLGSLLVGAGRLVAFALVVGLPLAVVFDCARAGQSAR